MIAGHLGYGFDAGRKLVHFEGLSAFAGPGRVEPGDSY